MIILAKQSLDKRASLARRTGIAQVGGTEVDTLNDQRDLLPELLTLGVGA